MENILDVIDDCMQDLSSAQAEESPCLTLLLPPMFAATYDLTYPDHHSNTLAKIIPPPRTVGQDVDELICENARKTRQNQAIIP